MDEKEALRGKIRRAMAQLTPEEREQSDRQLLRRFLALPQVERAGSLLLFYGVGAEVSTGALLKPLRERGKRVALPRCLPGRQMEARMVEGEESLHPGSFGIPEPGEDCPRLQREALDLILVPALCYDRLGYRLGQGGGYYDRYLTGYEGFTVGLCRERILQDTLPREAHDRRVGLVLTEKTQLGGEEPPPSA
jgi:5-formyltetrahydrofolate cyclo-ligase